MTFKKGDKKRDKKFVKAKMGSYSAVDSLHLIINI